MASARSGSLLLAAAILFGGHLAVAQAADPPPAPGGMVIYRDPITGELTVPPASEVPSSAERLRAPAEPLVEEPGTTPAGGWKMRLPRRLMHTMRATPGAEGKVATDCVPGSPVGKE